MLTTLQAFGIASLGIFGAGSYFAFKFNEAKQFQEKVFDPHPNKKQYLFQIHQKKAYSYDKILDTYEKYSKLDSYRKALVKNAYGLVLETGVGTSRNIDYYPVGTSIIGVDWSPNILEVAMMKPTQSTDIKYQIEDVEQLTFMDNTFDTVVDTFGLEYYLNPDKVIQELKRVCKKDGQILLLTSGAAQYDYLNLFLVLKMPHYLSERGYFINRDWTKYILEKDWTFEKYERKMNGTIYFYILKNDKK